MNSDLGPKSAFYWHSRELTSLWDGFWTLTTSPMNYRCVNNSTKQQRNKQTKNTKDPVPVKWSSKYEVNRWGKPANTAVSPTSSPPGTPGETSLVARSKEKGLYSQAIGGAGRDNHIPFLTWFAAVEACRIGQFRIKVHTWLRGWGEYNKSNELLITDSQCDSFVLYPSASVPSGYCNSWKLVYCFNTLLVA